MHTYWKLFSNFFMFVVSFYLFYGFEFQGDELYSGVYIINVHFLTWNWNVDANLQVQRVYFPNFPLIVWKKSQPLRLNNKKLLIPLKTYITHSNTYFMRKMYHFSLFLMFFVLVLSFILCQVINYFSRKRFNRNNIFFLLFYLLN